jgi:hypothetical protein
VDEDILNVFISEWCFSKKLITIKEYVSRTELALKDGRATLPNKETLLLDVKEEEGDNLYVSIIY